MSFRAAWPAILTMAAAVGLVTFRYFATEAHTPNRALGSVTFAAPFFVGGVVAFIGVRGRRPILAGAAGLAMVPISLVSIVMWPILIPAAFLIRIAIDGTNDEGGGRVEVRDFVSAAVVVVGIVGTFLMLVFHKDAATWQTPTGSASSSDIITVTESWVSAGLLTLVLGVAAITVRRSRN